MEYIFIVAVVVLFIIFTTNWYGVWHSIKRSFQKIELESVDPVIKEKRLAVLKNQYQSFDEICKNEASEKEEKDKGYANRHNNKCPKCGSSKVNDRIKRVQGQVDGHVEGDFFLFSGSMSGSMHGEMDTNEVNKCNDCQHESNSQKKSSSMKMIYQRNSIH
jgi:hypothetical protein